MQLGHVPRPALERARTPLAVGAAVGAALGAGWLAASRSPLPAAAAVLGALLGLWAARRVEVLLVGAVAVVALLPFGIMPLRLGVAPTLLDLATAGIFFVWLARAAAGRSPARLTAVGAALGVFGALLVAAYIFSSAALRPDETGRAFGKVVAAHLLFVPLVNLVASRRRVRLVVGSIVAAAAVEAAVGLALYAAPRGAAQRALEALGSVGYPTGDSVLRYLPDTDRLRAVGTAVDPNMLGALLMVAGALAVPPLLAARPALPRAPVTVALGVIALCLLLTYSRGAWLGLAGGVLVIGGLRSRRLWLAGAAVAVLAVALPQAAQFTGHLGSGLRAEDRAAAMRLGELRNAAAVIAAHPWFGVGWGGVAGAGGSAAGWPGDGAPSIELEFALGVSNVFLTIAERAGLLTLAAYLAALATLAGRLWPAVRRRLRRPDDDGVLLGLTAALVAASIAGLVDHHFVRFPHLVTLLWLVAALAMAEANEA